MTTEFNSSAQPVDPTVPNNDKREAPNPFDPQSLRLTQDFSTSAGVRRTLITIPNRKPSREWFVRTHPSDDYHVQTCVIELKEDREIYLVERSLWPELSTEATFGPRMLTTAVNRQGVLFIWPMRLPGPDGRLDDWSRSVIEAAQLARQKWVRLSANMSLGAYDVYEATANLPDPEWPTQAFGELIEISFRDRLIRDLEHPVIRRLRGAA